MSNTLCITFLYIILFNYSFLNFQNYKKDIINSGCIFDTILCINS